MRLVTEDRKLKRQLTELLEYIEVFFVREEQEKVRVVVFACNTTLKKKMCT